MIDMAQPISALAREMREKFWFDPLTDRLYYKKSNTPAHTTGEEWRVRVTQKYTLPYRDAVYLYMNGRLRARETLFRVADRRHDRKPLSRLAKKRIHRLKLRNARERQEQAALPACVG
jgi:hypothetical protein